MVNIWVVETLKHICRKLLQLLHREVECLHELVVLYLLDVWTYNRIVEGVAHDVDTREVCDDFLGTLYSKVLDKSAVKKVSEGGSLDTIKIPVLTGKVKVTADGRDIGMFDMNALKEKDKYRVFFGGNYGITDIKSGSNDRKLVVVKDSFANCFVPLLTEDYGEIVMIDMRYFSGNIDMIAGAADEILFLYELSNFAGDSNIAKLGM